MSLAAKTTTPAERETPPTLGPEDAGRRMTLAEFGPAVAAEGYLFELERGIVVVSDVPKLRHLMAVTRLRNHLVAYDRDHPGAIAVIGSGSECKLTIEGAESERHPDLALYMDGPPAGLDGDALWAAWLPGIVIEVVSESSARRDYVTKRQEYLALGLREYWIVDPQDRKVTRLSRDGDAWVERTLTESDTLESPALPGLAIPVREILGA